METLPEERNVGPRARGRVPVGSHGALGPGSSAHTVGFLPRAVQATLRGGIAGGVPVPSSHSGPLLLTRRSSSPPDTLNSAWRMSHS